MKNFLAMVATLLIGTFASPAYADHTGHNHDPVKAKACTCLRIISLGIYVFSLLMFLTGAFVAPYIFV